ncbi:hypothetical protein B296_00034299 [Ensete ventricosum]|uniref:Uncharacterized protein n=1 Tax=Ensete ventricosum TaxID=4639 RepID=A0A426YX45_ENSVE|nr:hypothetical protein B296_00034299 [Ensete ventricosum]
MSLPGATAPAGLHQKLDELGQGAGAAARPGWAMTGAANLGCSHPGLWPPLVGGFNSGFLHATAAVPSSSNPSAGGGDSVSSFMQRIGLHGFELTGGNPAAMSFASMLSGHGQQLPGLELGLSQDGHIGAGLDFQARCIDGSFNQVGWDKNMYADYATLLSLPNLSYEEIIAVKVGMVMMDEHL